MWCVTIDPFQAWRHITWHCELEDKPQFVYNMAAKASTKRGLLPGCFESLQQKESKERYLEKLKSIEGRDPYEIWRKEWIGDVNCWPDVTYINVHGNISSVCWEPVHLGVEESKQINASLSYDPTWSTQLIARSEADLLNFASKFFTWSIE